jgi:hypothetical protein
VAAAQNGTIFVDSISYVEYATQALNYASTLRQRLNMFIPLKEWLEQCTETPYRVLMRELAESLLCDIAVSLGRLLNGKDGKDFSVNRLISGIQKCVEANTVANQAFAAMIVTQHERLAECRSISANLKKQRDKRYAHLAKEYVFTPNELQRDFPLSVQDVVKLSDALLVTCEEHWQAATGQAPPKTNRGLIIFSRVQMDNMLTDLDAVSRERARC